MGRDVLAGDDVAAVRSHKLAATRRLLGDTISISDGDWQAPTVLPGWTRGHIATHIARNADGMRRLIHGVRMGESPTMTPPGDGNRRDLEQGSRRSALDLQIDLDTSAGRLNEAFDALTAEEWDALVPTRHGKVPLRSLPLARLNEVVLHHADLDCGYSFIDIEPDLARVLLAWTVSRRTDPGYHLSIAITSDSGYTGTIGSGPNPIAVTGTDANLLGWVTGRLPRSAVEGADHLSIGPAA